jgi:glycosyltransferase involved in cell wall biosynthesis
VRVLHVNGERGWRGGEQQGLYLVQGLAARGVEQDVVAQPCSPLAERAAAAGASVLPVRMRGEADLWAVWRLRQVMRRGGYDVVHLHTARAHTLGALAAASLGRKRPKVVVSRRVAYSIHRHGALGLNRLKYVHGLDRIICISQAVADTLVADGVPRERLRIVHSGIDLARFDGAPPPTDAMRAELGIAPGARVIGSVAALTPEKGQQDLVAALPAILAREPRACLVILGEGPLREALIAQARELGVEAALKLPGFRKDIPTALRLFEVFAFPSHQEGLGTSVLDALASRLPVAASRAGGIPEMIRHEETGLLVEPRDPTGLAAAIGRLLADRTLAERLAAAGRALVERSMTHAAMVEGTLAVYRELLVHLHGET